MANNFIQIIINIISAYIDRVIDIIHLAELEIRLALRTLIGILILSLVLLILLSSTWLCFLFLTFIYLISQHFSWLLSAFIITMLNVVLITLIVFSILRMKKNLSFPATRRQLKSIENGQTSTAN